MAAVATSVVVLMVVSFWWRFEFGYPRQGRRDWYLAVAGGMFWMDQGPRAKRSTHGWWEVTRFDSWQYWSPWPMGHEVPRGPTWFGLWPLAALASWRALVGFRANRPQRLIGSCVACRYPLRGAAVCPECGIGATK